MLRPAEREIIEENLRLVLTAPLAITQDSFIRTYNTVYGYCSVP